MLGFRNRLTVALVVALLPVALYQAVVLADTTSASISVGTTPLDVAVSPDSQRVYVTNNGSNTVSVINTASNVVIANVPVSAGSITNLEVSPNNSQVYVISQNTNSIQIISTASLTVIGSIAVGPTPIDVAFNPSGTRAYVTSYGDSSVKVINVATRSVIASIQLTEGPRGVIAIDTPVGPRVYVANAGAFNSEVTVIDPSSNLVLRRIAVSGGPFFLAATPDGAKVYASLNLSHQTASISTASDTLLATIADAGGAPFGIAVAATPTGDRVFVADFNGNGFGSYDLTRIDAPTDSFLGQLFVGKKPRGVSASPDGTRVYVAASGANKVSVIDTTQ
jgi:YVTN family beta-propeller protein